MPRPAVSHPAVLVVVAVVAVIGAVVAAIMLGGSDPVTPVSEGPADPAACDSATAASAQMQTPAFDFGTTRVDVIGDSLSVGQGLTDPRTQTWDVLLAQQLGWQLTVRGIGGTGFVNGGPCGDQNYQARVPQVLADDPQVVVVEGGLNDHGYPGIPGAALQLMSSLPSDVRVVVVGPPPAPALPLDQLQGVDDALRSAVGTAANHTYVSALTWQLDYQSDELHLTTDGNRTFADKIAAALG